MLKARLFALVFLALASLHSCCPQPAFARQWRHSWEDKKIEAPREKIQVRSTRDDIEKHIEKIERAELAKTRSLNKPGWTWIRIPKILAALPILALALFLQRLSQAQSQNLVWVQVRVIRETKKALRVEGASRDFWLPKSVVRNIRMRRRTLEIQIPIRCSPDA